MRKLFAACLLGAGAVALAAGGREPDLSLHEADWEIYLEGMASRRFMSLDHFVHHLAKLMRILLPLGEVYMLRAMSPAFRERVMIVTSMANDCGL